tara:strand:+ start:1519 stop:4986 length:3468 start_codon:yes stop_codon:yes gene_type:complete
MAKYILLEANRLRGLNTYSNISESEDIYKNKWTNLISPTGLVVNVGDTLSIEEIIVNSRGASDDVMEINGTENENGFIDNQVKLEVSYYINHIARNTARMPFINHTTYRGIGTVVAPTVDDNATTFIGINAESGQALTPIQDGTNANMKIILSRRSLGEVFLRPSSAGTTNWDPTKPYELETYCNGAMIANLITTQIGAGNLSAINTGYIVGLYETTTNGAGTGMIISIDSVKEEGGTGGIVDVWSIHSLGEGYNQSETISLPNLPDGTDITGTTHIFKILIFPALKSYQTSDIRPADGARYFYCNNDYTGLCNALSDGADEDDPDIDADSMVNNCIKRTNKVNLETKGGFLTPDNLATLLTDQMHEPTRITRENNVGSFIDLTDFEFSHNVPYSDTVVDQGNPVIVETPTYKAIPSNFDYTCINGKSTVAGARRGFYAGLAYKDPERYFTMKNLFYNFEYFDDNDNTANDISSGSYQSDADTADIGDFGTQKSGDLGIRVCLLNKFFSSNTGVSATADVNSPIVTNMLWTESNLLRIRKAFRANEKYMGDQTKPVSVGSDDYIAYLGVNLDLGMYDDELSTQGLLTTQTSSKDSYINQRIKFNTLFAAERMPTPKAEVPVDAAIGRGMTGYQRDINNHLNDGQQLSSIWVRSRHDNNIQFGGGDLALPTFLAANKDLLFDTNHHVSELFTGSWVDENGVTQTEKTAIQRSDQLDIMCIPIWGRTESTGHMYNERPFIAFVNFIKCDEDGTFNPLFPQQSTWKIDASNASIGTQLGFDPSFTRNEAVCSLSPMLGNRSGIDRTQYMNIQYMGSVNPSIVFDPSLSRFAISNLNTQTTISNGLLTSIPETLDANNAPEDPVIKVNRTQQIVQQRQKWFAYFGSDIILDNVIIISPYNQAIQKEGTIYDSQSGIAIESVILQDATGNETTLTTNDSDLFNYSLLDKMGFLLDQLLPAFGSDQAVFTNQFIFQSLNNSYRQKLINTVKPLTTGAYVSSAEVQTLSTNTSSMPMYDLGVECIRKVEPSIQASLLTAFNLPTKLSYPYLCVYSSLPSGGTDTMWIGGNDGHGKIPCMGYLTRNESDGDFYYTTGSSFNFTATKDFVITEVETDLRLPDGSRPRLQPQSCVIYKITKPIQSIQQNNIMSSSTDNTKNKKKR